MPKILPCPFCGTDQSTFDPELDLVFCNECHAESGVDGLSGWNRRSVMGALPAVVAHLRDHGVPEGTGKIFEARLARAETVDQSDPDALFKRDLTEALVTLVKCIRAAEVKKAAAEVPEASEQPKD